jgi:hypothetical protein
MRQVSAGWFGKLWSGSRPGRPWTAAERVVAWLCAALVITFGVAGSISGSEHGLAGRLASLASGLSLFGSALCLVYLSVKHPEIRRGFSVGRRK